MYAELSQSQKRRIRKTLRAVNSKPAPLTELDLLFDAPPLRGYESRWFLQWQTTPIKYLEMRN